MNPIILRQLLLPICKSLLLKRYGVLPGHFAAGVPPPSPAPCSSFPFRRLLSLPPPCADSAARAPSAACHPHQRAACRPSQHRPPPHQRQPPVALPTHRKLLAEMLKQSSYFLGVCFQVRAGKQSTDHRRRALRHCPPYRRTLGSRSRIFW
ncbi:hypothetical protein PVAP13_1NG488176 [Panicum virgatum]|uniref:Uncharacterized protein n=1 Tax=Panicum virgatum TaxID=38727 RepID=A0A8T0X6N4_PANVG|nr:hypothetical protein PVAP13_1NG488176 [Panicum virgatum]